MQDQTGWKQTGVETKTFIWTEGAAEAELRTDKREGGTDDDLAKSKEN